MVLVFQLAQLFNKYGRIFSVYSISLNVCCDLFFYDRSSDEEGKKERKFLSELKSGDKVVMKSGMHGRVNHVNQKEETCIIETTAGKLKFNKSMISMDASNALNK